MEFEDKCEPGRKHSRPWCVTHDTPLVCASNKDQISDGFHTFGELYRERSALTAALARCVEELAGVYADEPGHLYEAWVGHDDQPGFDGYRNVLYIQLPTGQVSWHFSDADAERFLEHVPRDKRKLKRRQYDGHGTPEKYARVEAFAREEDWRDPA